MSRPVYAPLCSSCRSFILSRLPPLQAPKPTSNPRGSLCGFSTTTHSRASSLDGQVSPTADTSTSQEASILREAVTSYLKFTTPPQPDNTSLRASIRGKPIHPQKPIQTTNYIFQNDNPNEELVTTQLVPITEALSAGNLQKSWVLYNKLMASPNFHNAMARKLLNRLIHPELFKLVMEKGSEASGVPLPIKLANDWADQNMASPTFYSQLLVSSLKNGEIAQIEGILKNACRVSPPYRLELAYLRGQVIDVYEESQSQAASTIEKPEIELWVLIYATYCYLRFISRDPTKEWPAPKTFLFELHNTIPQMRDLPTAAQLREVLASNGFDSRFSDTIVLSATTLENTNFFTHLRALREDIKTAVSRRDFAQIKSLYEDGVRGAPSLRGHQYSLFILAFASVNNIEAATKVWNDMLQSGVSPTIHTWNALLMGCSKARDIKFFMELWKRMIESGVVPDTFLWTTRIHALFASGHIRQGVESLQEMARNPSAKPNLYTINGAIDGLMRNNHVKEAQSILEYAIRALRITPDLVTYNTLLKGYMAAGDIKESLNCLSIMEQNEIKPDVVTCTIILNGLYKHSIKNGMIPPNPFQPEPQTAPPGNPTDPSQPPPPPNLTSTLFTICTNLIQQMRLSNIKANVNFYTVLIDGLLHPTSQNIHAAKDILRIMQSRGVEGTATTYTVFIRHFTSQGDVAGVESIWAEICDRGVIPDWILLEETVKGYARMRPPPNLGGITAGLGSIPGPMGGIARAREFRLTQWRDSVTARMLFWVDKIDDLNQGYPLSSILHPNSPQHHQQHPNRRPRQPHHQPPPDPDLLPATYNFFRLNMRTYKEVLARLLSEERYDAVEHVLGALARRMFPQAQAGGKASGTGGGGGGGLAGENWVQLEGLLRVCAANGIRVPEVLVEMVFTG